ncbi:hypothetical protein RIVM261_078070 [Rivularia sp. IAM M-261]|nr:hypothetical protein RIVM261_078070 [Rivularia sp. IAM M-261]
MLKKFCGQAFEAVNVALGFISLTAIAIGAVSTFSGLGLRLIAKGGVSILPEERTESLTNLGMGLCMCGGVGFAGAVVAAAGAASLLDAVDQVQEEESQTSDNNRVVFKASNSAQQESSDSLYLYQVMRIEGHRALNGKLIVGRIEDEPTRKVVIYDMLGSYVDSLMEIFDADCDELELVGKAFSSILPNPWDAVRDFIDYHRPQLGKKDWLGNCIEKCTGCRNFHGENAIVCGYYVYGWQENCACPDWQPFQNKQRICFLYEREEVIERLNQDIEPNQAVIQKNDDGTLTLWDNHTLRRFHFTWSGILLDDSDRLLELGTHARLLSYCQYFAVRAVVEFDYSTKIDEFVKQLKGIATIEIEDEGINIRTNYCPHFNINITRTYRFRFDGIPLYPYESIVPVELKHNYNLVTFIEWLKANKSKVRR